jgi:DNA-binding winged helix-turn-helix (wHTH) protein
MFGIIETEDSALQTAPPGQPPTEPSSPAECVFRFGRCRVSLACREIAVNGVIRPLQPQPFDLLVYLIEHRERVVTTHELLDRLWANHFVQPGTVASTVARVRKAVADKGDSGGEVIRTYHRVGYRFVAPLLLG